MAKPSYTAPPNDPPVLGSPNFAANAQGYLGWFPTFGAYCEALASWLQTEYVAALASGSAALPALAFASDPNTGIFRPGADQLGFSTNGVRRLLLSAAALQVDVPIVGANASLTQLIVEPLAGVQAAAILKSLASNVALKFSPLGVDAWSIIGTTSNILSLYDFASLGTPVQFRAGASSNTFVMDSTSRIGIGHDVPTAKLYVRQTEASVPALQAFCGSAAFVSSAFSASVATAGAPDFSFFTAYSSGGDLEFRVRGDGTVTADGSFTGGGADYAEYFEWADGNPGEEDRRGLSVVLVGDKIRAAQPGEQPIGVISANPSVVGDSDIDRWAGKYLRDDFGEYLLEDYQVVEWVETVTEVENGETVTKEVPHSYATDDLPDGVVAPEDAAHLTRQRRVLNPAYDPTRDYVPRADRPEWAMVGLMGKLRLRKGQPVDARWRKMRDVSAEVEEWLVR